MKKFFLSLILSVSTMFSFATDYKYIIVQNTDGTETTYALAGLKMSLKENVITVNNNEVIGSTINITDVKKMYFSETSAISKTFFNGGDGAVVYDMSGKIVGTYSTIEEMESTLKNGLYIIKTKNGVKKEIKK